MFNKEKCRKCKKKISENYSFCPYCGTSLNENEDDWGMLGKNDSVSSRSPFENELFGKMNTGILNKMLNGAMKMLENEMKKGFDSQNINKSSNTNFELYINGKKVNPKNMNSQIVQSGKKETQKFQQNFFTKEKAQEFIESPKIEPKTNIRRLSNKVVYELEMPDVSGIEDVSIIKLENSIEIKAIGKKKSYSKVIPINLPIKSYDLLEGKLILELAVKN
ncbi:zinc-ribbon domain-containing protein [Candidatus Pacearchaeota archaeon]|jgi:HSP20 family molecular chaperone IbpA|nr:zinc-ribbon domain-containing protein [Candidatus Pacearchaeota archaeon]